MTISKTLLMLSAALALSFSAIACDDDSSSSNNDSTNDSTDNNTNSGDNQQPTENLCGAGVALGTFTCDKNNLVECTEKGWSLKEQCGDKLCNANTKSCEVLCQDSDEPTCANASTRKFCQDGGYKTETCTEGTKCEKGACVEDPCAKCTSDQICQNDQCIDTVSASVIGTPCSCEGDDCNLAITGAELKAAINTSAPIFGSVIASFLADIADTDTIVVPNYFSKNNKGCEEVVAPEGMTVGCFRDATITFPQSILDLFSKVSTMLPLLGGSLGLGDINIEPLLKTAQDLLEKGIKFTSPNGYCLTAAIDISLDVKDQMISSIILMDKVNALLAKVNTGDHAKAKDAVCPVGSTLLSYTVGSNSDKGSADVGFDVCLKDCITDQDCRVDEGYSCVALPDGVPAEGQTSADLPTKKVCFDKKNIEYFENITNTFADVLPKNEAASAPIMIIEEDLPAEDNE